MFKEMPGELLIKNISYTKLVCNALRTYVEVAVATESKGFSEHVALNLLSFLFHMSKTRSMFSVRLSEVKKLITTASVSNFFAYK